MCSFYRFYKDGTFTIEGWAQGSNLLRTETWEIQNNKVVINVPEGQPFDLGMISGNLPAIENGEITINGSTLKTNSIGDSEVTATIISEDDYNAAIEDSKAKAPKTVSVGKEVKTDLYSFTVKSLDYKDEIYPPDTSGYYGYYADKSGSSYLVAKIKFKNLATDYMVPGEAISANFVVGGNNYSGNVQLEAGSSFGQSYGVNPKETVTMIIYASIPDEVKKSKDTTLTINMPNSIEMFKTYLSYVSDPVQYTVSM